MAAPFPSGINEYWSGNTPVVMNPTGSCRCSDLQEQLPGEREGERRPGCHDPADHGGMGGSHIGREARTDAGEQRRPGERPGPRRLRSWPEASAASRLVDERDNTVVVRMAPSELESNSLLRVDKQSVSLSQHYRMQ
jgi:hypothetical protein